MILWLRIRWALICYAARKRRDNLLLRATKWLPRRLRYWVVIDAVAQATTGPYSTTHPDTLNWGMILERGVVRGSLLEPQQPLWHRRVFKPWLEGHGMPTVAWWLNRWGLGGMVAELRATAHVIFQRWQQYGAYSHPEDVAYAGWIALPWLGVIAFVRMEADGSRLQYRW